MKKNIQSLLFLILVYMAIAVPQAVAFTIPSFPSCSNTQGTLKVQYDGGTHGIVGNTATYTGKDSVYTLSDTTLMQCFCADSGNGIQTNWWKVSPLSNTDIQVLKNQGWFYVPDGSLWGLDNAPYMAQNNNYTCKGGTGGEGGSVQGTNTSRGEVLGLASTGNIVMIYGVGAGGFGFLALGLYLYFAGKK